MLVPMWWVWMNCLVPTRAGSVWTPHQDWHHVLIYQGNLILGSELHSLVPPTLALLVPLLMPFVPSSDHPFAIGTALNLSVLISVLILFKCSLTSSRALAGSCQRKHLVQGCCR